MVAAPFTYCYSSWANNMQSLFPGPVGNSSKEISSKKFPITEKSKKFSLQTESTQKTNCLNQILLEC